MWEKASKAKKTGETSTPNQIVAHSTTSLVQLECHIELALVQARDTEHDPIVRGCHQFITEEVLPQCKFVIVVLIFIMELWTYVFSLDLKILLSY
jgi:hypothetical protein